MLSAILILCLQNLPLGARPESKDMTIDATVRAAVIAEAAKDLEENYVFPEVAKRMAAMLAEKQKSKEYDRLGSAKAFAKQLTDDLQAISHDKHLRVRYEEAALPPVAPVPPGEANHEHEPSAAELAEFRAEAARNNFGFVKVERLEGNVGYVDFREFVPAVIASEKATQVMGFLADTDALILDLRKNGGGSPDQVAWICSYLFEGRVHLNDLYFRPGDRTEEFWTNPDVPGAKYVGKDVYVLTSNYTFSGAEEFAYNLKTQERATLIGETTGGGANPGGMSRLHEHFSMFLPMGRAINPITKTNWEGVGVEPDVKIASDKALAKAQVLALEKLIASQPEVLPFERKEALAARQAELDGKVAKN
ncbi:MAG: S41 family peptidase [Planctomycetes bacterium]|nr:S41 family peptidase [Planctomycetota bacterium]